MADNVLGTNELLTINDQVYETWLDDWFVQKAVWETKTRTLKSLLLWWTAVGRVLDILWLREQNPSEMVEQLEKYRFWALNALNDNNNFSDKDKEQKAA